MGFKALDKPKPKAVRKGLWSPEEDEKLRNYLLKHGHGCWSSVPVNAGLQRNGKSCRLRWINYLRPGLKRGMFAIQEEDTILTLHRLLGNKWSQIAQHLPGRTDNEIKNYWHTFLKKKLVKVETEAHAKTQYTSSSSDNMESVLSSQQPTTIISSCDSLQQHEISFTDANQYCIPQIIDFPIGDQRSSLPKVFFAEWLSPEHVKGGNIADIVERGISRDGCDHNSNFQDSFMHDYLLTEGAFGSEYHNGLSDGSASEIFSTSQVEFEGKSTAGSDRFVDFNPGDDICIDFNMNNNVMYI